MATRKILTTKDCGCQVLELEERQGESGNILLNRILCKT